MNSRIQGLDVARALAVFGMILVNFKIAMGMLPGEAALHWMVSLFEGRAAATFVVLAGVGLSFMTRKARLSMDTAELRQRRWSIARRGLILIAIGLAYTPIWPADILHFYGFYFIIAAFIFHYSNIMLWATACSASLAFVALLFTLDYSQGWQFETLTYLDFWTVEGMLRHLLFNGFHPVFPWVAFLIVGLWLGRCDLRNPLLRRRLMLRAMAVWIAVECLSQLLLAMSVKAMPEAKEDLVALLGTSPMPPMPQYLIVGTSAAIVVICLCISVSEKFAQNWLIKSLSATGTLSLTHYVAHVVVGMGTMEALGLLGDQPIYRVLLCVGFYILLTILFSVWWVPRFGVGPLERFFRYLT